MTLQQLVTLVTLRVDEYTEDISGQIPEAPVGDIEQELKLAAVSVLRKLARPNALSSTVVKTASDITLLAGTGGYGNLLPLPDDYLRFVSLMMEEWDRPVTRYFSDITPIYKQQVYERRRATSEKPMAFLVPFDNAVKRALHAVPGGALESLTYVPKLEPDDMPDDYVDAMVWDAVARIFLILRQGELAGVAFNEATRAINELNQGAYGEEG